MEATIRVAESLHFRIWRWFFLAIMSAWTVILLIFEGYTGLGMGYLCLWLGVLPCAVFPILIRRSPEWAVSLALGYDVAISVLLMLTVLRQWAPSELGLIPFFPMAGFIIEGVFLTAVLVLSPRLAIRFAYACDTLLLACLIWLPSFHLFVFYIPAIFVIECILLTTALSRVNRSAQPAE